MSASSELVIDFLNLLEGNPSADWEVLVPTERDTWSGLYATAYFNTITGQIVTAFEGESTPGGNLGADVADAELLSGERPEAFDAAVVKFVSDVGQAALSQGLSTDASNMFVTGNSLGGYAAESVAQVNGYGGACFGAPGIPGYGGTSPNPNGFISFVNCGDPIGNRATIHLLAGLQL